MKAMTLSLAVVLGLFLVGMTMGAPPARADITQATISGTTLSLAPQVSYERATLQLVGPSEFSIHKTFAVGEVVTMALVDEAGAPLGDGRYKWILRISPRPRGSAAAQSGLFYIENGSAVPREQKRAELGRVRERLHREHRSQAVPAPQQFYTYSNDYFEVLDYDQDEVTRLTLEAFAYNYDDWDFVNDYGNLYIQRYPAGGGIYNPALAIDSAFNYVGIGGPFYDKGNLSLTSRYNPEIFFHDPYTLNTHMLQMVSSGAFNWTMNGFQLLYADAGQNVGIKGAPTADLTINDFYPITPYGNGFAAMRLYSKQSGLQWAFSATPYGDFTVNQIGSGGQEFSVNKRLDVGGVNTMQVQGSVQGTKFVASSSREIKTDFAEFDGKEVLAKLEDVPVRSWRYKTDHVDDRHVGPVAEDFHAAFQIGNDKTIANIDADGVALAAIKGLKTVVRENRDEVTALLEQKDREITELRGRLADLEERLEGLSPGG